MTRGRANGEGVHEFGHYSRALVRRFDFKWVAMRVNNRGEGRFGTWREAMDYALGLDTPSGTP